MYKIYNPELLYECNGIIIPKGYNIIYSPNRETRAKYWRFNRSGYVYLKSPDLGFFNESQTKEIVQDSRHEVIAKSPVFFTVTNPYSLDRYYIIVFAPDVGYALKIANTKYGCSDLDIYKQSEFDEMKKEYILLDILD